MPRISVLLPVHDPDPAYLQSAIASVLASSFGDLELIVIEDAPASASVAELLRKLADSRVQHLINDHAQSLAVALDLGIERARAPFIARMDADDLCEPDRFAEQIAMFNADPDLAVAGSQLTIIDRSGAVIGVRRYPTQHDDIAEALTRYNCLAHSSVMFRRDVVRRAGGYTAGILAEDYDLWCRLLLGGARFRNHSKALVHYRFHEAALKQRTVRPAIRATISIKTRYFGRTLGWGARARLMAERLLLLLPPRLVTALFARTVYERS